MKFHPDYSKKLSNIKVQSHLPLLSSIDEGAAKEVATKAMAKAAKVIRTYWDEKGPESENLSR